MENTASERVIMVRVILPKNNFWYKNLKLTLSVFLTFAMPSLTFSLSVVGMLSPDLGFPVKQFSKMAISTKFHLGNIQISCGYFTKQLPSTMIDP